MCIVTVSLCMLLFIAGCGQRAPEESGYIATEGDASELEGHTTPTHVFGLNTAEALGHGEAKAEVQTFGPPLNIVLDKYYPIGDWVFGEGYIEARSVGARLLMPYGGERVSMTASADEQVLFQVVQDGLPVVEAGGEQIENSFGLVDSADPTQQELIDDPTGQGFHTVELFIEKPGLRIHRVSFE